MSTRLSELQNASVGLAAGAIEVTTMQSTNYLKNAKQQGMPFTMDPRKLYRGYGANLSNMGSATMLQFVVNGKVKKMISQGEDRALTTCEEISAGFAAGFVSAFLCSPLELVMIQQQRKGGNTVETVRAMLGGGHVGRGIVGCAMREGIYSAGYLGVGPVIRKSLEQRGYGKSESAVGAAVGGGVFCCYLSHPFDTCKTCMQGDIERQTYGSLRATVGTVLRERGLPGLYSGASWRLTRQICAVFILDQARMLLSPIFYPDAFD